MRVGKVYVGSAFAGTLTEDVDGYHFSYDAEYLNRHDPAPVSLTLPVRIEPYHGQVLFPFFDGLIPEGWLLDIAGKSWKIDPRDRMGLLLATCRDCIGSVSIKP